MKIIYKAINFYDNLTVKRPVITLSIALLIVSFFSLSINDLKWMHLLIPWFWKMIRP